MKDYNTIGINMDILEDDARLEMEWPRKDAWFDILREIVNGEWVKVAENGSLKYRSGMDAGAPPPFWFGMNLNEIIDEYKEAHV